AARAGLEAEATRTAAAVARQLADAVPVDEANARASILGALDALLNRSMTPQINLADARGYAAQRPNGIVDTMRRYHRTEGYFKDRAAPYDRLSPDEWVRFINQASYEDLVNLYAATGPVVARIDWADARVLTRSADEPWIYSQQ